MGEKMGAGGETEACFIDAWTASAFLKTWRAKAPRDFGDILCFLPAKLG